MGIPPALWLCAPGYPEGATGGSEEGSRNSNSLRFLTQNSIVCGSVTHPCKLTKCKPKVTLSDIMRPQQVRSCLLISATTLVLAACAEDGGIGREGSPAWFNSHSPQEIAAYYEGVCRSYGLTPGTEAMSMCIASEVQSARGRNQVKSAAAGIQMSNNPYLSY